jgi:hypothetical protein
MFAGLAGLTTTALAIVVAFFPPKQITSLWKYEVTMFGITLFFIGMAAFFFFVYGRRKASRKIQLAAVAAPVPATQARP